MGTLSKAEREEIGTYVEDLPPIEKKWLLAALSTCDALEAERGALQKNLREAEDDCAEWEKRTVCWQNATAREDARARAAEKARDGLLEWRRGFVERARALQVKCCDEVSPELCLFIMDVRAVQPIDGDNAPEQPEWFQHEVEDEAEDEGMKREKADRGIE